jgi:hypothetical protein
MDDTTEEVKQIQREIFFSKTPNERFMIGVEMIKMGRTIVESSIKQQYSNLSELELRLKVFERYYKNEFSEIEFNNIINSMKNYYSMKNKELINPKIITDFTI